MCLRKSSFQASSSKPEALHCRQKDLCDIQRATMGMDAIYEAEGLQVPDPTSASLQSRSVRLICWELFQIGLL